MVTRGPSSNALQLTLEDQSDVRTGWRGPGALVITHRDILLLCFREECVGAEEGACTCQKSSFLDNPDFISFYGLLKTVWPLRSRQNTGCCAVTLGRGAGTGKTQLPINFSSPGLLDQPHGLSQGRRLKLGARQRPGPQED